MTGDADWNRLVEVNQAGAFRCCRAVLPGMVAQRHGVIVNVSSLGAVSGVSGQAAYAASKAALIGLTRALAREVGRRNIRVNAVLPGFVQTDMTANLTAEAVQKLRSIECLPRGITAADVAALVAFLAFPRRGHHGPCHRGRRRCLRLIQLPRRRATRPSAG
ncbi:MAG: SDR family oxidoreductase [Vicinamibacterales bacterium]